MKFFLFSGIALVLFHLGACETMTLIANVSMSKIKGMVKFTQDSPSSATHIDFNLTGITEPLKVEIHNFPMVYQGGVSTSCSSEAIGAIYDPTMSANGECSTSKKDKCAVGDISGKFGNIDQAKSKSNFSDPYLPLDGKNSIYSRTIVFMTAGNVVKACALITNHIYDTVTGMARIKGPGIAGTVFFRQAKENLPTLFYSNLFFINDSVNTKEFFLQIYTNRVSDKISADQCSKLGNLYNPFQIANRDNCNKTNHAGCPVGDLLTKDGYVNISQATAGPASTQVAYTDVNLPVIGSNSIIGHSLVLYARNDPTDPIACATILEIVTRRAIAEFTAETTEGVTGSFVFEQASPFEPTFVEIKISNLKMKAEGYHVHEYPNPSYKNIKDNAVACSLAMAGDHLNPYGINPADSPPNGAGTFDEYEIGDLSAKYGSFFNLNSHMSSYIDFNLPLFGKNSIIGRSLVIHNLKVKDKNRRWVCSNITISLPSTMRTQTKTHFTGPDIKGYIIMTQYNFTSHKAAPLDTEIYLNLEHMNGKQSPKHNWHVHEEKVGDDMNKDALSERCQSPGPHYNPFKANFGGNYKTTCTPDNPLRCELGDSSAKTAQYTLGSGPKFYTDIDTPLSGNYSVIGRSIVVHIKDGGAARQGCADIVVSDKPTNPPSHANHVSSFISMTLIAMMSLLFVM